MADSGLKLKEVRSHVRVGHGGARFGYRLEWVELVHTGDRLRPYCRRKHKNLKAKDLLAAEAESRKILSDREIEVIKRNMPGGATVDIESPMVVEYKITVIEVVDSNKHLLVRS